MTHRPCIQGKEPCFPSRLGKDKSGVVMVGLFGLKAHFLYPCLRAALLLNIQQSLVSTKRAPDRHRHTHGIHTKNQMSPPCGTPK